jgi:hypothetical protein
VALATEYDVTPEGVIELVGLINAVKVEGEAERYARRMIYREGNRQINHVVRAVGLGPRRR